MVNKRNKGLRYEREARNMLEEIGYLVEKKNYSRWETEDFWGVFDVLAIKPDGSNIKLVQVKTNISDFYKARKQVNEWKVEHNIENISCEVWLKEPRKPWRKEVI